MPSVHPEGRLFFVEFKVSGEFQKQMAVHVKITPPSVLHIWKQLLQPLPEVLGAVRAYLGLSKQNCFDALSTLKVFFTDRYLGQEWELPFYS